jgi:hypothetical protein
MNADLARSIHRIQQVIDAWEIFEGKLRNYKRPQEVKTAYANITISFSETIIAELKCIASLDLLADGGKEEDNA